MSQPLSPNVTGKSLLVCKSCVIPRSVSPADDETKWFTLGVRSPAAVPYCESANRLSLCVWR